jgi:hypothetical protein
MKIEGFEQALRKKVVIGDSLRLDDPQSDHILYSKHCKGVEIKMNEATQQKLNIYISKLNEIQEVVQNEQTAAILLLLTEITPNRYSEQENQKVVINGDAPATENQKNYLMRLGAAIPENLTRLQASQLIDNTKVTRRWNGRAISVPVRTP